jgi:predicted lipoprotein with Yx(FWY)xxD motif
MQAFNRASLMVTYLLGIGLGGCNLTDEYSADSPPQVAPANYVAADSKSYVRSTAAGPVMTTPEGMTVYIYDKEATGSASCYGECAEEWPPVIAPSDAKPFGELSMVDRIDGAKQWAYRGKPLHVYHEDAKPGDAKGDNKDGFWHAVEPAAAP